MKGHQDFDANEVWGTFSANEQQNLSQKGVTLSALQSNFATLKGQGVRFTQFIYSGGYRMPDGTSHYTVELVYTQGSQAGIETYYLYVGTDGKIAGFADLTAH